jgi:hypothetical protein
MGKVLEPSRRLIRIVSEPALFLRREVLGSLVECLGQAADLCGKNVLLIT